jgi:hypothetical protein
MKPAKKQMLIKKAPLTIPIQPPPLGEVVSTAK